MGKIPGMICNYVSATDGEDESQHIFVWDSHLLNSNLEDKSQILKIFYG